LSTACYLTIFVSLMNKGISHIFRSAVISVLLTGFLAHLVLPFSSHAQKTAFTRWLDHNIVATGGENELKLRNTIRKLPEQSHNFHILIKEASQIVANHKDDFRIHAELPEQSDHLVTSWLVGQWNNFQHQRTGSNAILPDATQPILKWISSQSLSKLFYSQVLSNQIHFKQSFEVLKDHSRIVKAIIPLVSGISINAP
jgi:hypothetical protein